MAEQTRPPVVTILGHVDHGKTTLLDFIRKASVAASEHGGITQAIGAYQVESEGKLITFIDTPGHAAFEKMRSRGAQLADIAVLVVSVDDGVMPQTVEAIKHILSANIPMIVAVNKIDLPNVNVKAQMEKIKRQLADQKVLIEEYGGDVPIVPLSAKTGEGVNDLLTTINLLSEIHELKGDPQAQLFGIVIEARLDKFKGAVATVLVRNGSLKRGDPLTAGESKGKVRGMFDHTGKPLDAAYPSTPVEVLGFETVPSVGAKLGEATSLQKEGYKGNSLLEKLMEGEGSTLNVVIKADNQGSLEAIETILEGFNTEGAKKHLKIVSSGTGDIMESDVDRAHASGAIVVGFNVKTASQALKLADTQNVLIRNYNIIYELAEELEDVVQGMLIPGKVEEVFGRAQIIAEFPFGKEDVIAGCRIVDGVFSKGPKVRIVREDEVIGEGKIKSIKQAREEVNRVEKGQECGMMFDPKIDFKIGDIVESFRTF